MALAVSPRVRRIAAAVAALLALLVLAGATYQGVATALERRQFLRPGGLVEVGPYQLHIYCVGQGSPTVVLEAAAGSMSPAWGWVQPEVAKITRVCSYDRSGLGWSEGDGRYVPSRVPTDLRTLLAQADEHGPFVLVGHEMGAVFARMFATRFANETAALVLVDDRSSGAAPAARAPMASAWPWLARVGILRLTGSLSARAVGLPGEAQGAMQAFLNRPDHLTQAAGEISRSPEVEVTVQGVHVDPSIPVMSVSIGLGAPPVMPATPARAAAITQAIAATVGRLRERDAATPHEP